MRVFDKQYFEIEYGDMKALQMEQARYRFYLREAPYLASLALEALDEAVESSFELFESYYQLLDKDVSNVFEMFDAAGGSHAGRLHNILHLVGRDNWPCEPSV